MGLDVDLQAALDAAEIQPFQALSLELPDGSVLRLVLGAATIAFDGHTYYGSDEIFGALGGIEPFEDGIGDEVPRLDFSILPPTLAAASYLCLPAMQGCEVAYYTGALDLETGLSAGSPDAVFIGEVTLSSRKMGANGQAVPIEAGGDVDRVRDQEEGIQLNGVFHKSCPGFEAETLLDLHWSSGRMSPWGTDTPRVPI